MKNLLLKLGAVAVAGVTAFEALKPLPFELRDAVCTGPVGGYYPNIIGFQVGTNKYSVDNNDTNFVCTKETVRKPGISFDVYGYKTRLFGPVSTQVVQRDLGREAQNYE